MKVLAILILFLSLVAAMVAEPGTTPADAAVKRIIEGKLICSKNYGAVAARIRQGIEYLRGIPFNDGMPTAIPDGKAHRVSCSWNAGIYIINRSPEKGIIPIKSWKEIADHAERVLKTKECRRHIGRTVHVAGESFDEHYSVVVSNTKRYGQTC